MTAVPRSTPSDVAPAFEGLTVALSVEDEAWLTLGFGDLDALALTCIRAAARVAEIPDDSVTELGVTFTSDAEVKALNAEWRGKVKPTNVLSFPMLELVPGDRPGAMLGDIIFARQTVIAEALAE